MLNLIDSFRHEVHIQEKSIKKNIFHIINEVNLLVHNHLSSIIANLSYSYRLQCMMDIPITTCADFVVLNFCVQTSLIYNSSFHSSERHLHHLFTAET